MLEVALSRQDPLSTRTGLLAVPVFTGPAPGPGTAEALEALGADLAALLEASGVTGKVGEALAVPTLGRLPATTLLLVGVGEAPAERDATGEGGSADKAIDDLRRAAATVVGRAGGAVDGLTTLAQVSTDPVDGLRAVAEGAVMGAYRFGKYKGDDNGAVKLTSLGIVPPGGVGDEAANQAVTVGQARGRATNLARDLSNEPANNLHPADLADAAEAAVAGRGVRVTVLDEAQLAEGGFGGIVGVGQGAANPPRLVELVYEPAGAVGKVILVGKGITFDSGGLSLKPPESMIPMKTDMSGAAAVVAVMSVLAELGVRLAVTGYLAAAENMPSGSAIRPSDVLTMKNGKTVEVLNTDAEGRLVMADALALGAGQEPDAIIDVATLTGACMVALGLKYTGLMSNEQGLADELLEAARLAGEPTWHLPLPEEYADELVSDVADLKNVGSRWGGALTAGLFLKEFVDGRPWAHLDIAGPSRAESKSGYNPKGSTGTAVRTLLSWLERRSEAGARAPAG
jgi:leucyl aminopeptidase